MDFEISLAQWSLHRSLYSGELDHLDFAKISKENFGIDAIEYVNSFFFEKAEDKSYLREMKNRADDYGVKSLLIMCDNEGSLGDPNNQKRQKAVENHYKWHEAAKYLGCHSIRVNAYLTESLHGLEVGDYTKTGSYENQVSLAADGLRKLTEFGANIGINTIVENHGGYSSNAKWLVKVIENANRKNIGTLPDFGNFCIRSTPKNLSDWGATTSGCAVEYDRYLGVEELLPYAMSVSAKSNDFDSDGNCIETDFSRMMSIIKKSKYRGYVSIEYEGSRYSEEEGIRLTKSLLEREGV